MPAQLPMISVTSGRSSAARRLAQTYQSRHSPGLVQVRGMQLSLTNGRTSQWSRSAICRIAGIHICACESPNTTIDFGLPVSPSRQIFAGIIRPVALQSSGKL